MKVFVIDSYENIPYGEHYGIVKVFSSKELSDEWVKLQTDDYSYNIEEFEVEDIA